MKRILCTSIVLIMLQPVEIFTFYSVQVEVIERDNHKNAFTATFPVAICDGGSGKTEIPRCWCCHTILHSVLSRNHLGK